MNEAILTVAGNVATDPLPQGEGETARTTFRLAHTPRRQGRDGWSDGETTFYDVTCWRGLGANVASSVQKGDPVLVKGRFHGRNWQTDERSGTSLVITADVVGHDLSRGTATFRRRRSAAQGNEQAEGAGASEREQTDEQESGLTVTDEQIAGIERELEPAPF